MKMQKLDSKFMKRFARENWERKPLLMKNIESDLLQLDDNEVFKLVIKAADRSRKDRKLLGFKFYVNGIRSSDVETLYVLPRKSDKTFVGYNERMERMYQDYCLVCDELLQVNRDKQDLLIEFTRQLYQHVGFPNRFTEMGLYLCNYRKTPIGVHRDPCGVFSFPVVGKKTFRAWTSSYVSEHPELEQSFRYAKHKAHSQVLTADTRDMIYWPSSAWHIAESDGSFSATWSLGVWIDRPTSEVVTETLMKIFTENFDSDAHKMLKSGTVFENEKSAVVNSNGEIRDLPDAFVQSISAIKRMTREELETAFRVSWMSRLAKGGLKNQAGSEELYRLGETIHLRDRKIFWTFAAGTTPLKPKFHFTYGNSGSHLSTSRNLLNLIEALNRGERCEPRKFIRACVGINVKKEMLQALQILGSAGAFLKT